MLTCTNRLDKKENCKKIKIEKNDKECENASLFFIITRI